MRIIDRLLGRKAPGREAKEPPPKCAGNPGQTVQVSTTVTDGERSREESFHLVELAARVLTERGHKVVPHDSWLELAPSGLILQPLLVDLIPAEEGGVKTTTTIDVWHPRLIPSGLFEYQHAAADTLEKALSEGFEGWEAVDLPVLLDALRPRAETCGALEMTFPAKEGRPGLTRRAVLGPVAHFAKEASARESGAAGEEDHAFCSCCFVTQNYEAFRSQLESDECVGIRFYAARYADGSPKADCRINGEDHEPGMASLRDYVARWPGSGFEFRKQYVLIHTIG